jgi:monoamine oxidase
MAYFFKVDAFPNFLSVFLNGARLRHFGQNDTAKIANDCMWLLERTLRRTLPRPTNVYRSDWTNMRNFLGSYSFLSMDTARHQVLPEHLAEPVFNLQRKPVLFFAGEAVDPLFGGYANGAVTSGRRAADDIIAYSKGERFACSSFVLISILAVRNYF